MKYTRRTFTATMLLVVPHVACVCASRAQTPALSETIDGLKRALNEQEPLLRPDGLMRLTFLSFENGVLTYKETFSRPDNNAHICHISKVVPLGKLDPETVNVTQNDRFNYWTFHYATQNSAKDIRHLSDDPRLNGYKLNSDVIDVHEKAAAMLLADLLKQAIRVARKNYP